MEKAEGKKRRKKSRKLKPYEIFENVIDLDSYVDHYTKELLYDETDFIFIPDDWNDPPNDNNG